MWKQSYEKHVSRVDKSRWITVVIGILYVQQNTDALACIPVDPYSVFGENCFPET